MQQDSIAERKRTEHALAALGESEAIYRATFDEAPVGIGLTDLTGRFLRVNRRLCELLGVSADALLSSTFLELTHPDDRSDDAGARDRLLDGTLDRYVGEKRYRHADGRYVWVAISVNLQRNASGEPLYFLATVEDISARRAAEDRSRSASAHLRAVVSALPLSVWSLDRHGIVTLSEGRLLEKLGFLPGQLVGQSQFELYAADSQVMDWTRRALAGETLHNTNEVDGIVFETWYSPIRAPDGGVSGTIGVAIDVTERVRLDEELRQTQKMEAIGRLAGGIAHDFNNLLTAITGYAEVALEANRPAEDARADIEEILRASQMASALTRQLLAFSRRQVPQVAAIDVNVIVGRIDGLLRRLIGDDVELRIDLCEAPECVRADAGQIEQVIMNLALNARDAMPAGGCLTVETRVVALDDEFVARHHGASVGPHVRLTVSDTGVGMTEASRRRAFEPFFTTKEQGKGTGLGLSTVYGIVKHSGGSVWVASEPGRGTTLTVYLPVVAAAPVAARPAVAAPTRDRRHRDGPRGRRPGSRPHHHLQDAAAPRLRRLRRRASARRPRDQPAKRSADRSAADRRGHAGDERPRAGPHAAGGTALAAGAVHVRLYQPHGGRKRRVRRRRRVHSEAVFPARPAGEGSPRARRSTPGASAQDLKRPASRRTPSGASAEAGVWTVTAHLPPLRARRTHRGMPAKRRNTRRQWSCSTDPQVRPASTPGLP